MAKYRPRGPRGIGGLGGLDPQALLQKLQEEMANMEKALQEMQVTGTAGGGVVEVVMNGQYEVLQVKVDPELLQEGDVEMLQDLLVSAFNNAAAQVRKATEEQTARLQQALGPLAGLLGGL